MPKPIRVAILGQGRSGRDIHGACLSKHPDYQIIAAADIDENRRRRAASEYGCEIAEDYHAFLNRKDIDLFINTLPSPLHAPVTLEFLRRGQSVLCEKPIAASAEDVERMMLTAKSTNASLYFFQQNRFVYWFTLVREILASGVLGRPVIYKFRNNGFARRWDWQTLQCMDAGSLRNTGPHPMDQAVVLMNNKAMPEIFCHFDRVNTWGDAEDFAKIILRVPNGPVFDMEISSCDRFSGPIFSLQAQNGSLRVDSKSVVYDYFEPKAAPAQKLIKEPLEKTDGTPAYCSETLEWVEKSIDIGDASLAIGAQPADGPTEILYNKLYAHIRDGTDFEIRGEQILQQIAIINECHRLFPLTRFE